MSGATRAEVRLLLATGLGAVEVARRVGCGRKSVWRIAHADDGVREWSRPERVLSLCDREEISRGVGAGRSLREIARQLGRSASTVSREVAANGGRGAYRAVEADRRAGDQARRPKQAKLAAVPRLRERVEELLEEWYSPEQISATLLLEFPHDPDMQISHETIYQSLYVQGRGALRKELTRCLRTGRARRKPHGSRSTRGRIVGMVNISERPAEVDDRAVPGHWEGDLILGKAGGSQIGTLVERTTRFVMLVALPGGRTAEEVADALVEQAKALPEALRRTLTWDQGTEMAGHAQFSIDSGVDVYFCDPHSPWQRGSNENTNGLLRQYFPKGTDLSGYTQADLNTIADKLNQRPRKTLGWMSPSQAFNQLVATTA